ncbi:enoyl-CoA hydratase/isomerase [Rhodopila sp.]|jgi:2-(1,2-epoxy-1,2-dihydrophenyl)acetyl-CoA isomerase|uniref:enoyl-CoA hydratase/isomerase n=1 Tax=Rhodopila sp. TaxID=2480087 RepID=UPI002BC186D2|nr:enoyl-CoA hydratase/isomerase [Rhodopila sp.]HVZ09500.1 enoyl-CoA hydratase/isomerase [Rhodopila sp.]
MKHGRILLQSQGDVTIMTLNDPSVLNAFGQKLREDMGQALDQIEQGKARCLVITGAGRAFCSGANLNDPDRPPRDRAAEARGETKTDLEAWYNPTFMRLRALPIPIITAINGIAAGAGMSLALSGDIRVAARSAYFLQAFARIGLVPDCGSSWILPRLIGMARAMELSLLAERLPAETALQWGMINRLEDDDALMAKTLELAQGLAAGPRSLGLIRQMYWQAMENGYADQLALESKLQTEAAMTSDFQEGVAAFREKRRARFTGR